MNRFTEGKTERELVIHNNPLVTLIGAYITRVQVAVNWILTLTFIPDDEFHIPGSFLGRKSFVKLWEMRRTSRRNLSWIGCKSSSGSVCACHALPHSFIDKTSLRVLKLQNSVFSLKSLP